MTGSSRIITAFIIASLLLSCMLFSSCKKTESPASDGGQKLKIAATIFPLADIAKNIGGEKVSVVTIMPPGASPHTFEPTYQTIREAAGIKALFKIGCGLDDWAQKVTSSLGGKIEIIELSKNIELRHLPDSSVDPHYWLSLANGRIIARNIAGALAELDPANKDYYFNNLSAYQQQLDKADEEIKSKLASLTQKKIVTFHEAWFYFAQAYGLEVAEAFEPFPGKEPNPQFLAHFIDVIKKNNINVVFIEPQLSPESIHQVASDLNLKIRTLDPEGGGMPQTATYIGMLQYNTDVIYNALK
jgi:zinc transport system substrate-binding protein